MGWVGVGRCEGCLGVCVMLVGRIGGRKVLSTCTFFLFLFLFSRKNQNLVRMRCDDWLHDLTAWENGCTETCRLLYVVRTPLHLPYNYCNNSSLYDIILLLRCTTTTTIYTVCTSINPSILLFVVVAVLPLLLRCCTPTCTVCSALCVVLYCLLLQ